MQQPNFYRVGAGAAMLGAVVGLVFNLMHPRNNEALTDLNAELQMVAESGIWRWDHIGLGFAVAIGFIGFIAINFSMFNGPSDLWARAATIVGAVGAAIILVLLALDGTVLKNVADKVVGGDDSLAGAAHVLVETTTALLGASIAVFFGLGPLLFGEALLGSGTYSRNLGYAEMLGGAIALLTALMFTMGGLSSLAIYGFLVSSLLHTVVLFLAGWSLWQRSETVATPVVTTTAT